MIRWRQVRVPFGFTYYHDPHNHLAANKIPLTKLAVNALSLLLIYFNYAQTRTLTLCWIIKRSWYYFCPSWIRLSFSDTISLQWRVVSLQYVHPRQQSQIVWTGKSAWTFSSILTASMERNDECASGFWMNNIYSRWSLFMPLTTPYQLCTFWLHGRLLCF